MQLRSAAVMAPVVPQGVLPKRYKNFYLTLRLRFGLPFFSLLHLHSRGNRGRQWISSAVRIRQRLLN